MLDAQTPGPGDAADDWPARADRAAVATDAASPRNASYSIDVTLDPATHTLTGREVVTWRNTTPNPTSETCACTCYWNAWRRTDSTWLRESALAEPPGSSAAPAEDGWGRHRPHRAAAPRRRRLAAHRSHRPRSASWHQTMATRRIGPWRPSPCPQPVGGGATVNVAIDWTVARAPHRSHARAASARSTFIAHWFPKMAVLEHGGLGLTAVPRRDRVLRRLRHVRCPHRRARGLGGRRDRPAALTRGTRRFGDPPLRGGRCSRFRVGDEPRHGRAAGTVRAPEAATGHHAAAAATGTRRPGGPALRSHAGCPPSLRGVVRAVPVRPRHDCRSGLAERRRWHGVPDDLHGRDALARAGRGAGPRGGDRSTRRAISSGTGSSPTTRWTMPGSTRG